MSDEARLQQQDAGLTPVTDGWFVVGIADAPWVTNEALGAACVFEGDDAPFPDVGFTLHVLQPGQANGMYPGRRIRRTSSSSPASACS